MDDAQLRRAIRRLPELAAAPVLWGDLLQQISEAAGAEGALLLQREIRTPDVPRTPGVAELVERYFRQNWHVRDVRTRAIPMMMKGRIGVDQAIIGPDEMARDEMYAELFTPLGFRWWAGIGFFAGDEFWCLALQRTIRQGAFEPAECASLLRLIEPLSAASTIARSVGAAELGAVTSALDLVGQPALVLDRTGKVVGTNARADTVFDNWICIRGGRLHARDHRAAKQLSALTDQIRSMAADGDFGGLHLALPRGPDRAPLLARPLALSGALLSPFADGRALLLLTDLAKRSAASEQLLRSLFDLTRAEAALASRLSAKPDLTAAAAGLKISRETARTQLRAVFAKTGTHGQAELAALLTRLGGPADEPPL